MALLRLNPYFQDFHFLLQDPPPLTLQSFLFWQEKAGTPPKKSKDSIYSRTPEILGKESKNAQKATKIAKRKKEGKRKKEKKKQGLEGQGQTLELIFKPREAFGKTKS